MKDKTSNKNSKLELAIFNYFHQSQTEEEKEAVARELAAAKISPKKLDELLSNHFYLAPQNILYAQLFFAALCYLLTLAITVVRIGSDAMTVIFSLIIGTCLALPYILNYIALFRFKSFKRFRNLGYISFYYSIFAGLIFVLVSIQLSLTGVILIPVLLLILYYLELKKLDKLEDQLDLGSE